MTVILAVEYGWQGMRELSLAFAKLGASVDVLVKGRVPAEVLAMITKPAGMRVQDAPRELFRWILLGRCFGAAWMRRPVLVVAQRRETAAKETTRQWLECLGRVAPFELWLCEETKQGRRLMRPDGAPVALEDAMKRRSG